MNPADAGHTDETVQCPSLHTKKGSVNMKTSIKLCGLAAAVLMATAGSAMASDTVVPYVLDSQSKVVTNSTGLCWRTSFWTPALAEQGGPDGLGCTCDKDILSAAACTKAAPVEEPRVAKVTLAADINYTHLGQNILVNLFALITAALIAFNFVACLIRLNAKGAYLFDAVRHCLLLISIVLVCFAAISLVVSSVMIGIITYVSVVERTKEIGILRSLGARKRDIYNVFNAESFIVGLFAGVIGIIVTYILQPIVNVIIQNLANMGSLTLCVFNPLHALLMIVISFCLTVIAGLVPSSVAAKRDPVVALRSE